MVVCTRVRCEGHEPVEVGWILNDVDAGGREHDGVELEFPPIAGPVVGDQALAVEVEGVERELLVGHAKLEDDLAGLDADDERLRRLQRALVEQLQDGPPQHLVPHQLCLSIPYPNPCTCSSRGTARRAPTAARGRCLWRGPGARRPRSACSG